MQWSWRNSLGSSTRDCRRRKALVIESKSQPAIRLSDRRSAGRMVFVCLTGEESLTIILIYDIEKRYCGGMCVAAKIFRRYDRVHVLHDHGLSGRPEMRNRNIRPDRRAHRGSGPAWAGNLIYDSLQIPGGRISVRNVGGGQKADVPTDRGGAAGLQN